jgi:hypothetical protein
MNEIDFPKASANDVFHRNSEGCKRLDTIKYGVPNGTMRPKSDNPYSELDFTDHLDDNYTGCMIGS